MQEMRKPFPVITNDEAYSMPGLRTGDRLRDRTGRVIRRCAGYSGAPSED